MATEIYLPASAPSNTRYGLAPQKPAVQGHAYYSVTFEDEVWYNSEVRVEARRQIKQIPGSGHILVGFSKSGSGALNMALDDPTLYKAVVIFDSPLCHNDLPPWNTTAFYDQASWEEDLPLNRMDHIAALAKTVQIIHIGGHAFCKDHQAFDRMLSERQIPALFAPRPDLDHHWDSGWVAEYVRPSIEQEFP